MGCHTYAVGIRDLDGKFKDMVDLKLMCDKTKVSYPQELEDYFKKAIKEYGSDDLKYLSEERMTSIMTEMAIPKDARTGDVEYNDGMIIDLSKLPADIKKIRIYMSC
jgi:hypothetical protein